MKILDDPPNPLTHKKLQDLLKAMHKLGDAFGAAARLVRWQIHPLTLEQIHKAEKHKRKWAARQGYQRFGKRSRGARKRQARRWRYFEERRVG